MYISFHLWNYIFGFLDKHDESAFLLLIPQRLRIDWFEFMTKTCNKEQKEVLWNILFTNKNMMILGEPGTGKTYLLKLAKILLNKLQILTQVCAFTGLAGQQADGATLHRKFPLHKFKNPKDWNNDVGCPTHNDNNNNFACFNGVLFIDEISMVSPVMFEQIMYFQKNADKHKFRVIVVGDFWQLPPIESALNAYKRKFFFQTSYIYKFDIFELTIPQRHCDQEFLSIIRLIRKNDYNLKVMNFFQERKVAFEFLKDKKNKLYLFHDNKRVDQHNVQFLNLCNGQVHDIPFEILSIDSRTSYYCGQIKISKYKELNSYNFLSQLKAYIDIPQLSTILSEQNIKNVSIKIGCHIMFNKNIYGLINCNNPTVCGFHREKCVHTKHPCINIYNGTRATIVNVWDGIGLLVEFENKEQLYFPLMSYPIEISSRRKVGFKIGTHVYITKGLMKNQFGKILEDNGAEFKLEIKKQEFTVNAMQCKPVPRFKKIIANIKYHPIVLSYALTIQKSQGMTLDNIVLSLQYIPSPYLVTVAISRCRTAQGVFINGVFKKPCGEIDPLIINFTKQLTLNNKNKLERKFLHTNNIETLFSNFQIKITTKNDQFIVTTNISICPFFTMSKNLAIKYIYDLCSDFVTKNAPHLLDVCTMTNIISLLANKKIKD